jgi:hypothetical protein
MTTFEQQIAYERQARQQAEYDSIVNALAAATSDSDNAQARLQQAWAVGDAATAADAQRQLSRAESRILQLENGRDAYEQQQPQTYQQQPVQQMTPQDIINSMTGLIPEEKAWLQRHPELITNQNRISELQGTYAAAMRMGLARGTPEYEQFFNERLGLDAGSALGLRPEQVDAAKISGVSLEVYAENERKRQQIDAKYGPRYNR